MKRRLQINWLILLFPLIGISLPLFGQKGEANPLGALIAKHAEAVRKLEERAGAEKLRNSYSAHLRKLLESEKDPEKLDQIKVELIGLELSKSPEHSEELFPKLERLRKIFDDGIERVSQETEPDRKRLDTALEASLKELASTASPEDKPAILAALKKRFPNSDDSIPTSSPGKTPETDSELSLISFSVLQEQPIPVKPTLTVPVVKTVEEFENLPVTYESVEEDAAQMVGTVLDADVKTLAAQGISRSLLIYSGEGENRKAIGSLVMQGDASLEVGESSKTELILETPGNKQQPPRMKDGDILLLQKQKEAPGTFIIKAGPSTISVRGTEAFLIPKSAEVAAVIERQNNAPEEEASLLVTNGTVEVSGTQGLLKDKPPIEVKDKGMLGMVSLARMASFFEQTEYAKAYNDHLQYYPTSSRWLLGGENVKFTATSLRTSSREYEPYRGQAIISFAPTDARHYRYLTFDWKGSDHKDAHWGEIEVFWGSAAPDDCSCLHFRVRNPDIMNSNSGKIEGKVVIDLWGKEGELLPEHGPVIDTLTLTCKKNAFAINSIELWSEGKVPWPVTPNVEAFRTVPIYQTLEDEVLTIFSDTSETREYIGELNRHLEQGIKKIHIFTNTPVSSNFVERSYGGKYQNQTPDAGWALLSTTSSYTFSKSIHDNHGKLLLSLKHAIAKGADEINIHISPILAKGILSSVGAYAQPTQGIYLTNSELATQIDLSEEELAMSTRYYVRRIREKQELAEIYPRLHEAAVKKLYEQVNPEGKPVVIRSILEIDGERSRDPNIELEELTLDESGDLKHNVITKWPE